MKNGRLSKDLCRPRKGGNPYFDILLDHLFEILELLEEHGLTGIANNLEIFPSHNSPRLTHEEPLQTMPSLVARFAFVWEK